MIEPDPLSAIIPWTREFVVDDGYAGRVTWALVKKYTVRSPLLYLGIAMIVAGVVLFAVGQSGVGFLIPGILVGLGIPAISYFSGRQNIRQELPPGSHLRSGFGVAAFALKFGPMPSMFPYSKYQAVERQGEFVFLLQRANRRQGANRRWVAYPGQLFGDEDLARFPQAHSASPQG